MWGLLRDVGHTIERALLLLLIVHLPVARFHGVGDHVDTGSCDLSVEGGVLVVRDDFVADVHGLHLGAGAEVAAANTFRKSALKA
jgi:hypothetical protein